jgi:hypothetical protein
VKILHSIFVGKVDETNYDNFILLITFYANELVITDFFGDYTTASRSYIFFFLDWIPGYTVGKGNYSFTINGEIIKFLEKILKSFNIVPFSKEYWGYTSLFAPKNGKENAPLLIVMSDPNDNKSDSTQNGFYLVIPKEQFDDQSLSSR